tara:strand:- start:1673 stop:2104 length:432 start_codon:yes stop_codon:yes gene_type:complete
MKEITKATVKLNKNGLLVDVAIDMNPQDGDGLYIIHFAIVEETKDELRFSVLATTNLSDAHTEDDLIENTSEIWTIALDNPKAVEKARLILATMVAEGSYYQRTTYSWPDREPVEKADKQDVSQLKIEFNKLLQILRDRQETL